MRSFRVHPRFSLKFCLLLMGVSAIGVWWITWPDRTANRFLGNPIEFAKRHGWNTDSNAEWELFCNQVMKDEQTSPQRRNRTWRDRVVARRNYRWKEFEFSVVRGKVAWGPRRVYYFGGIPLLR